MNNKAQEFSPIGIVGAVLGFIIAIIMVKSMGERINLFWKIATVVTTTIGTYLIAWKIGEG